MGSKWKTVPLGECAEVYSGFAFKSQDLGTKGIPVVKIKNVNNKIVDFSETQFFPENLITSRHDKYFLKDGDVLIAMTGQGSVGRVGRIRIRDNQSVLLNQRVGKFITKKNLDIGYLYYVTSSDYYEEILFNAGLGSGQPNLSPSVIAKVEIPLPPLPEQITISHILGSLDDKIELNRRMNATLEGMAQALFKSWFVDFDPVVDNAIVAGNPIPDEFADRAEIRRQALADGSSNRKAAKSFPSAFQLTETMGWIPDGWTECMFDALAKPKKGKNITKQTIMGGNIPVVAGGLQPAYFHNAPNVYGPAITISASGANAGFVNFYQQDIWASDCTYISSKETDFVYSTFLFLKNRQDQITHMQQGAAQPHVYPKDLLRLRLANPPRNRWQEMETTIAPLFHKISVNENENQNLTKLRDTLLPKLISGELRIGDAEKLYNEASIL